MGEKLGADRPLREERDHRLAVAREIMDEAGVLYRELHDQLTPDVLREIAGLGHLDNLLYGVVVSALRFVVAFPVDFRYWVHYEYRRRHGGKEDNLGDS